MQVIYKRVGKPAEFMDIPNDLETLQKMVGGYIEIVPIGAKTVIICNEEGRLLGLPLNTMAIAGDYLICGTGGVEFCDAPHTVFMMAKEGRFDDEW